MLCREKKAEGQWRDEWLWMAETEGVKTGRGRSCPKREAKDGQVSRGGPREQSPGRVLFTLEDLKPLSRGKVRSDWKERRERRGGRGGKGERGRGGKGKGSIKVRRGELQREAGQGRGSAREG